MLKFSVLSDNAKIPCRMTPGAAGFDLYSAESGTIEPHDKLLVKTDIACEIPSGFCGKIESRSSLVNNHFVLAFNGVIDSDYRGPIGVILMNHSNQKYSFAKNDRIAQLVLYKIDFSGFTVSSSLSDTDRGSGGFGSTGTM
jgi:dUTP pyrophosphatase